MTRYTKTFAEAYREIYENAATEIQKQVAKGGMDKNMFQKSADLLKSKKYDELKTFLKKSDTSPREYVMSVIAKKEPNTFKKMYGSQTGYYSLMNQKEIRIRPKTAIEEIDEQENVPSVSKEKKEEESKEKEPKKDPETLESQILTLKGQLSLIKQKLENEKNKVVKPQPNKETGEVPLRTGIANAILDKKIDTKKLVKSKKKDELAVGGKTKIEINPKADIGVFSGGNATNSGNLH